MLWVTHCEARLHQAYRLPGNIFAAPSRTSANPQSGMPECPAGTLCPLGGADTLLPSAATSNVPVSRYTVSAGRRRYSTVLFMMKLDPDTSVTCSPARAGQLRERQCEPWWTQTPVTCRFFQPMEGGGAEGVGA